MKEKPKFLNIKQLAAELNVPVSWIYSRTRETGPDSIPFTKMGKYLRFEIEKVLAWLQDRQPDK